MSQIDATEMLKKYEEIALANDWVISTGNGAIMFHPPHHWAENGWCATWLQAKASTGEIWLVPNWMERAINNHNLAVKEKLA